VAQTSSRRKGIRLGIQANKAVGDPRHAANSTLAPVTGQAAHSPSNIWSMPSIFYMSK
jgi:hypothetical protein